ncbi:IS3 family transposase [Rothia nasimurium]
MENFFGHLNAETYHGGVFRVLRSSSRLLMSMFLGYNNNRFQERLKGLGSGGVSG